MQLLAPECYSHSARAKDTPALGPNIVALSVEHLDFVVLHAQHILHVAVRPLERLLPLRELHELGLDMRPRSVAVRGRAGRRGRCAVAG